MTKREIRELYKVISPNPGFILDLTRNELDDLVYNRTQRELPDKGSNGKRLETLLLVASPQECSAITAELLKLKENK